MDNVQLDQNVYPPGTERHKLCYGSWRQKQERIRKEYEKNRKIGRLGKEMRTRRVEEDSKGGEMRRGFPYSELRLSARHWEM
jgi:hypothetical protein